MKPKLYHSFSEKHTELGLELAVHFTVSKNTVNPKITLVLESGFEKRISLCASISAKDGVTTLRTNSEFVNDRPLDLANFSQTERRWSDEQKVTLPPQLLVANKIIELSVLFLVDRFALALDGRGIAEYYFTNPVLIRNINRALVIGDVHMCELLERRNGKLVKVTRGDSYCVAVEKQVTALVHSFDNNETFSRNLSAPLRIGTRVIFSLRTREDASFTINFENAAARNVVLHFNPRSSDRIIVRNSFISGRWLQEERGSSGANQFPLLPNTVHDIEFSFEKDAVFVGIDNNRYCTFRHRLPIDSIDLLSVGSVQTLLSLTFA